MEFENIKTTIKDKDINFKDKETLFFLPIIGNFNGKILASFIKPIDARIEIGIIE
ncbi:unnamed protein product [marine sediment metagenome]|uniref:Uncharacterized protein n=1 Tax=marine sediment metagenome TaxID=412755 RepID=X1PWT6_9ZZZZ